MPRNKADRVLLGLLVLCFTGFLYAIKDSFHQRVVEAGDSAPSFSINTENGRNVSISNFGGKLLVLNFWATWCPPCVEEMPSLNEFARQMSPSGVVVLGVSIDKNETTYKTFIRQMKPAFQVARDPKADISTEYGSFKWPETYVIRDGKVVLKYIGPKDWTDPKIVNEIKSFL
jgi:peroxiredoxin